MKLEHGVDEIHTYGIKLFIPTSPGLSVFGEGRLCCRDVHENGKDWDPMGPMGFPWEWE